jgi:hypothetical protein
LSPLSALGPLPTDALVTRVALTGEFGGPFCLEIDRGDRDDLRDLGHDIGYRRLIASSPHRLIAWRDERRADRQHVALARSSDAIARVERRYRAPLRED